MKSVEQSPGVRARKEQSEYPYRYDEQGRR
jgi:hypothetical protein